MRGWVFLGALLLLSAAPVASAATSASTGEEGGACAGVGIWTETYVDGVRCLEIVQDTVFYFLAGIT